MASSDFQRLVQLTDAIQSQRKGDPAAPISFTEDTDIHAKALAVFEAQGVSITSTQLQAATADLDRSNQAAWKQVPIVPLAVQVKPPRRWWRSRAQRASDDLRWVQAFQKVRRDRHASWGQIRGAQSPGSLPNTTVLSADHRLLLDQIFPARKEHLRFISFVDGMPGPIGSDWVSELPLNHCLLDLFIDRPRCVDLPLAQWVLDQDATVIHRRAPRRDWGTLAKWMGPRRRASLLELFARCGHAEMLAQLSFAWPAPRTWTKSLLWWALVLPLVDDRQADHEQSPEERARLELTVRFILAHEPEATGHHARVIQEALALHHPHSDWLRQWLAIPQGALT